MSSMRRDQKKRILLLGGGHANIQVLHGLASLDASEIQVTLISDSRFSPYSGMIPSFMAGVYKANQLHFDLESICHRYGFQFVEAKVTRIEASQNKVETSNGQIFEYDICSINLGIQPQEILGHPEDMSIVYLKPISKLIEKWEKIKTSEQEIKDITVIGGGAGAFEIAVACRRFFSRADQKIRMITGSHLLLAEHSKLTRQWARQSLSKLRIDLVEGKRVEKIEDTQLVLNDGTSIKQQICFIGITAKAPSLFRDSNLPRDEQGFVLVDAKLRVQSFENIFAAGDCCHFAPKNLPKAGVYAVRQGPILLQNIQALLNEKLSMVDYKPQKNFLTILVSGENQGIASYANFAVRGRLAWILKNRIDLKFMTRFQ